MRNKIESIEYLEDALTKLANSLKALNESEDYTNHEEKREKLRAYYEEEIIRKTKRLEDLKSKQQTAIAKNICFTGEIVSANKSGTALQHKTHSKVS